VALGCILAAATAGLKLPLAGLGVLAWGQWACAVRLRRNIALVVVLFSRVRPVGAPGRVAAVCATLKFGLLFAGLAYSFYGLASRLIPGASTRA
jgi:hypothetical protein